MQQHLKWDQRYLRAAKIVAHWSKDPSTQCGAVIVRPDKTVASTGFNGFPRMMLDLPERYEDRSFKYPHIIHSEWNAIQSSNDATLHDCTVFAWPMPPCHECTSFLLQKKIGRVVCAIPTQDKLERWSGSFEYARKSWSKRGVSYDELDMLDPRVEISSTKDWSNRFLFLAKEICSWSKDQFNPRGAVIVRPDKTISSLGFTGFAQGMDDNTLLNALTPVDMGVISAEINAVLFSQDSSFDDCAVFSWPSAPSLRSVVHLVHEGVKTFYFPKRDAPTPDIKEIELVLKEVGGTFIPVEIGSTVVV